MRSSGVSLLSPKSGRRIDHKLDAIDHSASYLIEILRMHIEHFV